MTRLLQSSLQGQARIAIICAISPTAKNIEESLNTLKFARRAKRIVPKPEIRPIFDDKTLLKKYKMEIEELKKELHETNIELEKHREHELPLAEKELYEMQLEEARLVHIL